MNRFINRYCFSKRLRCKRYGEKERIVQWVSVSRKIESDGTFQENETFPGTLSISHFNHPSNPRFPNPSSSGQQNGFGKQKKGSDPFFFSSPKKEEASSIMEDPLIPGGPRWFSLWEVQGTQVVGHWMKGYRWTLLKLFITLSSVQAK